jgi:hypothetical protein
VNGGRDIEALLQGTQLTQELRRTHIRRPSGQPDAAANRFHYAKLAHQPVLLGAQLRERQRGQTTFVTIVVS